MTNVRIVRDIKTEQGVLIRREVHGEWEITPQSLGRAKLCIHVLNTYKTLQYEEGHLQWRLETRGTEAGWHEIQEQSLEHLI